MLERPSSLPSCAAACHAVCWLRARVGLGRGWVEDEGGLRIRVGWGGDEDQGEGEEGDER